MTESKEALLADFERGIHALRASVAGMSPDQLKARPIAGKWSTHEVVCHLVDSEQAWCHRLKRIIAEPRPLLVGYDESLFTAALRYHDRELEAELDLFESQRRQLISLLAALPDDRWDAAGVHTERGLLTLAEGVRLEADHVFGHVAQIQAKRLALGLPELL